MKYVPYYRVSTASQGKSGLGLSAQQDIVQRFLKVGYEMLEEFIEVESGKRADRPQLAAAIAHAKQNKACLLIAKLDRLSRNVSWFSYWFSIIPIIGHCHPTYHEILYSLFIEYIEYIKGTAIRIHAQNFCSWTYYPLMMSHYHLSGNLWSFRTFRVVPLILQKLHRLVYCSL